MSKKLPVLVQVRPHDAEFGHFTLLFYSGRQRNVPKIRTLVHSHSSAHYVNSLVPEYFLFLWGGGGFNQMGQLKGEKERQSDKQTDRQTDKTGTHRNKVL